MLSFKFHQLRLRFILIRGENRAFFFANEKNRACVLVHGRRLVPGCLQRLAAGRRPLARVDRQGDESTKLAAAVRDALLVCWLLWVTGRCRARAALQSAAASRMDIY